MILEIKNIKFSKADVKKIIKIPTKITCDLAEETGLHMRDGSMNFYSGKGIFQLRGHLTDDRDHYESRIKKLYKKLYNLDIHLREMKSTGVFGFQVWSNALVEFKHKSLGLKLGKKDNLIIPTFINNQMLFFSFMRGFFDTDGSIHFENKRGKPYPRIDIKTTSKELCLESVNLLKKYGINATKYTYKRKEENWNDLHSIIVRGFPSVNKWIKNIGSNNPKHIKKFRLADRVK